MPWTSNELARVGQADELQLTAMNEDGTPRKRVIIWVARAGDELYVRSYKGRGSAWFRHAVARPEGRVSAGGVTTHVRFIEVKEPDQAAIDAAFRSKYRRYGAAYTEAMVHPTAQAATLQLVPTD